MISIRLILRTIGILFTVIVLVRLLKRCRMVYFGHY
jgi:hypothetical protein